MELVFNDTCELWDLVLVKSAVVDGDPKLWDWKQQWSYDWILTFILVLFFASYLNSGAALNWPNLDSDLKYLDSSWKPREMLNTGGVKYSLYPLLLWLLVWVPDQYGILIYGRELRWWHTFVVTNMFHVNTSNIVKSNKKQNEIPENELPMSQQLCDAFSLPEMNKKNVSCP